MNFRGLIAGFTFLLAVSDIWGADVVAGGTRIYDEESVSDLFEKSKVENERQGNEDPLVMGDDFEMEVELESITVRQNTIRKQRLLEQVLNPKPRRKVLNQIAEYDRELAYDLQYDRRSEDEFFSGTHDVFKVRGSGQVGSFDVRAIGNGVKNAVSAIWSKLGRDRE